MAHRFPEPAPPFWADPVVRPLLLACGGLALVGLSVLLRFGDNYTVYPGLRVLVMAGGLIVGGVAIREGLRLRGETLNERLNGVWPLLVGALTAFLASAVAHDWLTVRLAATVAGGVCLAGAVLLLVPPLVRKILVSVAVVVHFAGIFVAIVSVDLPTAPAPWVANKAWANFYRPYLGFLYMTNAYHFYSPDPGPSNLLWFRVEYSDGSSAWIKRPSRGEARVPMEYQRGLALAESTNATLNNASYPAHLLESKRQRREVAARFSTPAIPMHPGLAPAAQYAEPMDHVKEYLKSYARHAIATAPPAKDPSAWPEKVKVYRVTHQLLGPGEILEGRHPMDPVTYTPFYQGEYDAHGNLLSAVDVFDERTGQLVRQGDPYLWWVIPIMEVPKMADAAPGDLFRLRVPQGFEVKDYVAVHAGDVPPAEPKKP